MRSTISWKTLISKLHRLFASDCVNTAEVKQVLSSYKSNPADWRKYAMFDPGRYTRNLVIERNHRFHLILLGWSGGQSSSIHDHANSHCFMKQLQGSLVESLYEWPEEDAVMEHPNKMVSFRDSQLKVNDVIYIFDNVGLHRVGNASQVQPAVSLHLVNFLKELLVEPPVLFSCSFSTGRQSPSVMPSMGKLVVKLCRI